MPPRPTAHTSTSFSLARRARLGIKPQSGEPVWVWSTGPSRLVVTPSE